MQQGIYPDEFNKLLHNKDIDKGYRRKHIPVSRGLILSVFEDRGRLLTIKYY